MILKQIKRNRISVKQTVLDHFVVFRNIIWWDYKEETAAYNDS